MYHPLKLFCADTDAAHVSEHYDEIIFNQPVAAVGRLIQKLPPFPDKLAEFTVRLIFLKHYRARVNTFSPENVLN